MRINHLCRLSNRAASAAGALLLAAACLQSPAVAGETAASSGPPAICACPSTSDPYADGSAPRARFSDIRPLFDRNDEAAALEAVQVALTEVGDGSTYVWYRHGGRLTGQVRPTQSFKDVLGRVCRHIAVTLSDGSRSRHTEGIACRLPDGEWLLDG